MLFKHPTTLLICGPTQSGKSSLVRKIIKQNLFGKSIKNITWCYSAFQKWFLNEPFITFKEGIPDNFEDTDLVIIDDLMLSLDANVASLFTVKSHHLGISVIVILQNIFPRSKFMRDISLNSHYIILFKNNRDLSQVACFAKQAFPGKYRFFMDAYKKATEKLYGHLVIDCHPTTTEKYRLRDSCFPDEDNIFWVFIPQNE